MGYAMPQFSQAYIQVLERGPLPGQVDPWAEAGRYFQQLHTEIISHLLGQIRSPLLSMGYIAGRETSLQIAENTKPDLYIQRPEPSGGATAWDYPQAAEIALAEPGVLLEVMEPELDALYIRQMGSAELVTVVEIISPRNKSENRLIDEYLERRARRRREGVHVVEIDLTRSVKRLVELDEAVWETTPYHVVVHLHDQPQRFIGMKFGEALKRCALPLRGEVVAVELQAAYDHAYRQTTLAGHILNETGYSEAVLPFPSLLPAEYRAAVLKAVGEWQNELTRLRTA